MEVCGVKSTSTLNVLDVVPSISDSLFTYIMAFAALAGMLYASMTLYRKRRAEQRRVKLQGEEVSQVVYADYGSIARPSIRGTEREINPITLDDSFGEQTFVGSEYYPERPRWIL